MVITTLCRLVLFALPIVIANPVFSAELGEGLETLPFERGRLVFPVDPKHPFAKHQQVKEIETIEDIGGFGFVRVWRQLSEAQQKDPLALERFSRPILPNLAPNRLPSESILLQMAKSRGKLFELKLADFIVPAGSTVVLSNPFNRIRANKVIIAGTLISQGELQIIAKEIGGGSGNVDVLPGCNGASGTDRAADPKPPRPGTAPKGNDGGGFSGAQPGSSGMIGQAGQNGGNGGTGCPGSTIVVQVETLLPNLTVNARGGNGGKGGDGASGGDGGDGGVGGEGHWFSGGATGGSGGAGGPGGNGGNGGGGGNGGQITMIYTTDASGGTTTTVAAGGSGGPSGRGGQGGLGGFGGTGGTGGWASFGAAGSNGPNGSPGPAGVDGSGQADAGGAPIIGSPGSPGAIGSITFTQKP
jgi:hypothetical protein